MNLSQTQYEKPSIMGDDLERLNAQDLIEWALDQLPQTWLWPVRFKPRNRC